MTIDQKFYQQENFVTLTNFSKIKKKKVLKIINKDHVKVIIFKMIYHFMIIIIMLKKMEF